MHSDRMDGDRFVLHGRLKVLIGALLKQQESSR